jgi:hypothetical protein
MWGQGKDLPDNIGAWQITLRVADNICGLSISYRKKIANVIRWDYSTHIQVQRAQVSS